MTTIQMLEKLATEKNTPCVTISLNTHRTHPDNVHDIVLLKNLLKEAENRIITEFGKRPVQPLLDRLAAIEIDVNHNLDSLHIYVSNNTTEIVKSIWPADENGVHIANTFNLRPLIKLHNRNEAYYILLLSQSGTKLYHAAGNSIVNEVENDDFPFSENRHFNTHPDKGSDPKLLDNLVRVYLNSVDKAVVKMHHQTGLDCVVICTEDNYSRLMQVADKPGIYAGYDAIDYNNTSTHQIVKQSWEKIKAIQQERRANAIAEMKEAVAQGTVVTDLQEIYQASMDGRGDLLIIHHDFSQPVLMTGERTFELTTDRTTEDAIDDITSKIAWEVLSKKGRVFFTGKDEIKDIGEIVLKTRY